MTILGLLAGLFTTACWVPQLVRSWKTRSTDDLSWTYLVALVTGVMMWLAYGIGRGDATIIAPNAATLTFLLGLSTLKVAGAGGFTRMRDSLTGFRTAIPGFRSAIAGMLAR